jgi:hypothetical protein
MPKMAVKPTHACLWFGIFTPAIRAISFPVLITRWVDLTLPLLVTRLGTNHTHNIVAADDLAITTQLFD